MTDWPQIIRDIMKEETVSQRRLETASGVSRSTLKRVLRRDSYIRSDHLEDLLTALGYSLTVEKTGSPSPLAKKPKRLVTHRTRGRRLVRAVGMGRF